MSINNRELLRINTGAADTQLFSLGFNRTFFRRCPWNIATNILRTRFRRDFTNVDFGGTATFEYPKDGVILEDIALEIKLSALTGVGAGSYARFCDYLGCAIIKEIRLSYSQYPLQKKTGQHLFINFLRDHPIDKRQIFEDYLAGELSAAARNTRALAEQTIRIPLKFFWYKLASHAPVSLALSQLLTVQVDLAAKENVIQSDYSSVTGNIVSVKWIYDMIQTTGADRDEATMPVLANPKGQSFLIEQTNSATMGYTKIPAGVSSYAIELKGFTAPWATIYATIQNGSQLYGGPYTQSPYNLPLALFNNIKKYSFRENETVIENYEAPFDVQNRWEKKHVISQFIKPVLMCSVAEVADIKNQSIGSLNASNMNNFNFVIEFYSPLVEDAYIYFTFIEHNWVNQQGGEMMRIFTN